MKKRTLPLLLVLCTALSLLPGKALASGTAHFTDVPASHWAHPYVERAYQDGAITGTGGDPAKGTGTFSPDSEVTYGQFLVILTSAFYAGEVSQERQAGDPWYAPGIRVALKHKLTYISQDWLMDHAEQAIDRYNTSYIAVKLLEDKGAVLPSQQERDAAAARTGDWEKVNADSRNWCPYVSAAVAAGIMTGVDDKGTFAGSGHIYRSSAAVIYTRLADKLPQFKITFDDNWDLITVPGYQQTVEDIFHEVYPRLYARWGTSETQKTVSFRAVADPEAAVMATWWENGVRVVGVAAAKQEKYSPTHSTAHELTHVVATSYHGFTATWWRECLAEYGEFRYHKWADASSTDGRNYFQLEDRSQQDWAFTAYGGQWFFAYMDSKYPTTPKGRGLIDSIYDGIMAREITTDDINDPNFNAVVQKITGYSTIEALRQQFVKELEAGTWTFNGFAGYADNYITENLPGVPNPTYPTAADFNLCTGTYTYYVSGETSDRHVGNNLVDGDRTTKWQATELDSNLSGSKQHELYIDLCTYRTFDTYVLYHEGSQGKSGQNTVSWKITYKDNEADQWKTLDEVSGNTEDISARTFEPVTAKILHLSIYDSSGTGDGTVRLYELEVYDRRQE